MESLVSHNRSAHGMSPVDPSRCLLTHCSRLGCPFSPKIGWLKINKTYQLRIHWPLLKILDIPPNNCWWFADFFFTDPWLLGFAPQEALLLGRAVFLLLGGRPLWSPLWSAAADVAQLRCRFRGEHRFLGTKNFGYPLVNIQQTMENHHFSMGKSTINHHFP